MATLEELRVELDKIDNQMVELYQKRMNVCREVGDYKVKAGRKVYDRQREQEKLADVASKVDNDFDKNGVRELYTQLMSMSRKLQYQKLVEAGALGRLPFIQIDSLEKDTARVVFQGTEGAYGEAAMHQFFGEDVNCFHVRTFRDAMTAIEEGAADYAVLPIENSSAGPVNEMYDLLDEFENYIVAETILPVVHTLSGLPGTTLTDIKRVYSKAEALMQTTGFLNDHAEWQQISVVNTAIAPASLQMPPEIFLPSWLLPAAEAPGSHSFFLRFPLYVSPRSAHHVSALDLWAYKTAHHPGSCPAQRTWISNPPNGLMQIPMSHNIFSPASEYNSQSVLRSSWMKCFLEGSLSFPGISNNVFPGNP